MPAYYITCTDCDGTGLLTDPTEPCVYCDGKGHVEERRRTDAERRAEVRALEAALRRVEAGMVGIGS